MSVWDDALNAQKYDAFAREFGTYQHSSRDLVEFAQVTPGMQVVDLGCGTGVTTQALLNVLGAAGHIYSVDEAQAMLDVARTHLTAENVTLHLSPAEKLHDAITTPVDCIVCNSAFWQMSRDETLAAVRATLKPGGSFTYNLPSSFFEPEETPDDNANLRGNFGQMMRDVAQAHFDIEYPPLPPLPASVRPSIESIKDGLKQQGFADVTHKIIYYAQDYATSSAFCTIPVMTERMLPGVDYATRMAILAKTIELDPDKAHIMRLSWLFLRAQVAG